MSTKPKNIIVETFYKVRKYGITKSIRKLAQRMVRPYLPQITFYNNLTRLILTPNFKKKRILGIWDYRALPWSVGDPLFFIETLNVLKVKHNAEEVDICVVYDPDYFTGPRGKGNLGSLDCSINLENAKDFVLEFLPLFSTCPYIGSVYQFTSRSEFYRFLKNNIDHYDIFPPLRQHLSETYNFLGYDSLLKPIREFFALNGYIPYLRIGARYMAWAQWLYITHLPKGTVPVVLSLKKTQHSDFRNADPAVWLSFIDRCKLEFPEVVFFVVGLQGEVLNGLRSRSNVMIAKDFGTSIMEDLALIRASFMYMGMASGVNLIAMFSDLPYLIFQSLLNDVYGHGMSIEEKYSFLTKYQKIFSTEIELTSEKLFEEFKKTYLMLDKDGWQNKALREARRKHGLPNAKVLD